MSNTNQNQPNPFGLHLMIDAYNCSPAELEDANIVYRVLNELPAIIDMHKLTKPYIVHTEGNGAKDPGGWSGFVIIEESHISIHTFVKRKFFTADVYSCKQFDYQKAIEYFKTIFKTEDLETYTQVRGTRYPESNLI